MTPRNENGRVTEVAATASLANGGAIPASYNRESISAVAIRAMGRFLRTVADLFPTADTLARYRESPGIVVADVTMLCRECAWSPATIDGRCFACHANDRRPAA